jgi:hypothetical protein
MKKATLQFALSLALLCTASNAWAKAAKCEISSSGEYYVSKCNFQSESGGSFSLSNLNESRTIISNILIISVYVTQKNVAEVRGLTTDGINSRWGQAIRSTTDRACWVGDDFEICAR